MAEGTLQRSFTENGFTFIEPDPGCGIVGSVFLHVTHIAESEDARRFVRGARVTFDVKMMDRAGKPSPQARSARLIDGSAEGLSPATISATDQRGTVKFWSPGGFGFLIAEAADSTDKDIYVQAGSVPGGYLRNGDLVQFDVQQTKNGPEAINVQVTGWSETGEPFNDMLDMGRPNWAPQLAELAEDEPWNYREKPAKDRFAILRSYVKYTFLRLEELPDHLVYSGDEGHLSFNTGLVTPFQEQIFALFRKRQNGESGPPWVFRSFEKASSFTFLKLFGGSLPPLAWYYDQTSQLVYDTTIPLSVNVEHVPHDPDRFSDALKVMSAEDLAGLVNAKAPEAIERVRRNYKTAIPQFYRDSKSGAAKMQLLLPVALLSRNVVELALAVDHLPSGVYLGRTVLSLDWAYNNARLLTRPDTDWLRP